MGRLPAGSRREILRSDPNRPRNRKVQLLAGLITLLAFVGVTHYISGIVGFAMAPRSHPSALASAPAWAIGAAAGALAARLVWTKLPKG
jgi:tryptophan-rich sensory protein